jgi:uncharacterized protein
LKHKRASDSPIEAYLSLSGLRRDLNDVVCAFVGGSELHGAKVEGTDDHDVYGVYIETPAEILGPAGMTRTHQHFVWSTAGDDRKNTAADVDVTLYSLQKWAYLASKGNLTVLHFLFAENNIRSDAREIWTDVVAHREAFLAKSHLDTFLHFARNQFERIEGKRGRGKKGQRPELERTHGYDTKAAMHAMRILYEAEELLLSGDLKLPGKHRAYLVQIREGTHSLNSVLREYHQLEKRCLARLPQSCLPPSVDRSAVDAIIARAYLRHWKNRGSV